MAIVGKQVVNGKAFEYALLTKYVEYISSLDLNVKIVENKALETAKNCYDRQSVVNQIRFDNAAVSTIPTIIKLEPGLISEKKGCDCIYASLSPDSKGELGDVRDIIFSRPSSNWEMGFSAKNNNDAIKHSRLSNQIDFGSSWFGVPCTSEYWRLVTPIFKKLEELKNLKIKWADIEDKSTAIYRPILEIFRDELLRISISNCEAPAKLIQYLIGRYPFYKVIKDDKSNLVVVKAFNINDGLNRRVNDVSSRYSTPKLCLPTRIVEFDYKKASDTTLNMILDGGWEISFRIHSASTYVEPSLKFDIQLLGNPPILFTQHLFQD